MAQNIDILYVITKANWGGAQRYVYDLACAMRTQGRTVAVAYGEPGLLTERLGVSGIRTIHVPALGRDVRIGKDIAAYRALTRLFSHEAPRIVHLNSSKAGFVGALAAKKAAIPRVIFTAHGWAFTEPRNPFTRKLFEFVQKKTAHAVDKVIAVSDFIHEATRAWDLPEGRVVTVVHGIEEPSYLAKDEARTKLVALDPSLARVKDRLWVGTIAELHRNKGLDVGIEGWKRAAPANAEWVILGDGDERDRLTDETRERADIHFLGFVPDAAIYLKAFDLFLLPSRTEALGYALIEAGLANVPLIASEVGGTREAGGPDMLGFRSEDAEALSSVLTDALADPSRDERGRKTGAYARERFSLERMVRETVALY